jgi:hypothetical protein
MRRYSGDPVLTPRQKYYERGVSRGSRKGRQGHVSVVIAVVVVDTIPRPAESPPWHATDLPLGLACEICLFVRLWPWCRVWSQMLAGSGNCVLGTVGGSTHAAAEVLGRATRWAHASSYTWSCTRAGGGVDAVSRRAATDHLTLITLMRCSGAMRRTAVPSWTSPDRPVQLRRATFIHAATPSRL